MYGIFVSERGGMRYARYLVDGIKTVETRGRNMLQAWFPDDEPIFVDLEELE